MLWQERVSMRDTSVALPADAAHIFGAQALPVAHQESENGRVHVLVLILAGLVAP